MHAEVFILLQLLNTKEYSKDDEEKGNKNLMNLWASIKKLTKDLMSIPVEIISLVDGDWLSWTVRETYVDIYMQITITKTCSTCKVLLVKTVW